MVRVLVVEGGGDVLPMVVERRRDVLLARDDQGRVRRSELEEGMEAVDRQELGDVGTVLRVLEGGDLRQLAVLLGELGRRGHLDLLGVAERALGKGREPAQRLDLVPEEIDPDRTVLGRREDIEQAAPDRELAAILDLVDALVSRRDEVDRRLAEVEELAGPQREAVRAQRRVGHLL